jgi:hypothetical protein
MKKEERGGSVNNCYHWQWSMRVMTSILWVQCLKLEHHPNSRKRRISRQNKACENKEAFIKETVCLWRDVRQAILERKPHSPEIVTIWILCSVKSGEICWQELLDPPLILCKLARASARIASCRALVGGCSFIISPGCLLLLDASDLGLGTHSLDLLMSGFLPTLT